jgi:glycerol-3-phosphate cytidylyltransferase-like family protein
MRDTGRKTIVILHDDKSCYLIKGKIPFQHLKQRIENLKITGLVDKIYITRSIDPEKIFKKIANKYPDRLYMRGDDTKDFPGKWRLQVTNTPIEYVKYTEGVSSTFIREQLNDR